MNVYDLKIDSKGRIMLPKQVRSKFESGARLVEAENGFALEPLEEADVLVELDIICSAKELVGKAWKLGLFIKKSGTMNGYDVIQIKGKRSKAKQFCNEIGYDDEDFEDLILK